MAIVDVEKADLFEPIVSQLITEEGIVRFVVIESHEGKGHWDGMENWDRVMHEYQGDASAVLREDPGILPEDNSTIIFTSGTTGLPSKLAHFQALLPLNPGPFRRRRIEYATYGSHNCTQCKYWIYCDATGPTPT